MKNEQYEQYNPEVDNLYERRLSNNYSTTCVNINSVLPPRSLIIKDK